MQPASACKRFIRSFWQCPNKCHRQQRSTLQDRLGFTHPNGHDDESQYDDSEDASDQIVSGRSAARIYGF